MRKYILGLGKMDGGDDEQGDLRKWQIQLTEKFVSSPSTLRKIWSVLSTSYFCRIFPNQNFQGENKNYDISKI